MASLESLPDDISRRDALRFGSLLGASGFAALLSNSGDGASVMTIDTNQLTKILLSVSGEITGDLDTHLGDARSDGFVVGCVDAGRTELTISGDVAALWASNTVQVTVDGDRVPVDRRE